MLKLVVGLRDSRIKRISSPKVTKLPKQLSTITANNIIDQVTTIIRFYSVSNVLVKEVIRLVISR